MLIHSFISSQEHYANYTYVPLFKETVAYCIVVVSRRLMPPDAPQPNAYCTSPGLQSFLLEPPGVSTRDNSSERRNYLGEKWLGNFDRKLRLPRIHFRVLLHDPNMRHGTNGFTSLPKEGVLRIFSPWKIRPAGFEPANLGTKGQHATSRPPKPLATYCTLDSPFQGLLVTIFTIRFCF